MKRNPERTKGRILEAALHEFAAHGFAGARIDEIADRARVNKRMLYHYFGDKQGLYLAVYRAKMQEKTRTVVEQPPDLLDSLPYWYRSLVDDPEWIRMLGWEALTAGSRGVVEGDERAALYAESMAWVKHAQEAGSVPLDLDPDLFLLMGFSLNLFPFAFPQITRDITGADPSDPALQERYEGFLRALAERLRP